VSDLTDELTPTRPYLLRAMHEWMSDNGQTPLILVDALRSGVQVPDGFVEDDHIVLNISWSATRNLELGNDQISFEARFSGTPQLVSVPLAAVKGVYARESGQGMMFQDEPSGADEASVPEIPEAEPSDTKKPGRPGLRVVK